MYDLLILIALFITNIIDNRNSQLVTRMPEHYMFRGDRNLQYEYKADIFNDYFWMTPPLYGKEVFFDNDHLEIDFVGGTLKFIRQEDESITMDENGLITTSIPTLTQEDHYYNLDIYKWKAITRPKQNPGNESTTESVPVTQTQSTTGKLKSGERVLDIPQYPVYKFTLHNGNQIILYLIKNDKGIHYFFQHVGYCIANEIYRDLTGYEIPYNIILIDGDQDGYFDGLNDYVMEPSNSPKSQLNKEYRQIFHYMDNKWYRLKQLAEKSFINLKVDPISKQLSIKDANTPFHKERLRGAILLSDLPVKGVLQINGRQYKYKRRGEFESKIEYGTYKAVISKKGYLDQIISFTIDKDHQTLITSYSEQPRSATLTLTNHGFRTWQLSATNEAGEEWSKFNDNVLALPSGNYKFIISGGGCSFYKEAAIQEGEDWEYDFTADTLRKK